MDWMGGDGWGWGMGGFHMLFFWGAVILVVVLVVKWLGNSRSGNGEPPTGTPLEILKERYVRGDIGREEFEQKKRDLEG